MKKLIVAVCVLFLPLISYAHMKTYHLHFYSDANDFDGTAYFSYRVCTKVDRLSDCIYSFTRVLKFHAFTGENDVEINNILANQFIIGYELSIGRKMPPYVNSPENINQACKAVKNGDTLTIQPATAGLYACNGEMSRP